MHPAGSKILRAKRGDRVARPPKLPNELSRARDARRQRPWVELDGEPLPAPHLEGARRLRPETRAWWKAWCSFGEQAGFIATDWQTLKLLVPLVDDIHRAEDPKARAALMAELRRNEKRLSRGRRS